MSNQVALKYYQPVRALAQNNPSGNEYAFVPRASISMAWVDPMDVDSLLSRRGGCCNKRRQLFSYANEDDIRRWTNGGGR